MDFFIPISTWIWLAVITAVFLACFLFVIKFKNTGKLLANRRIVEYFPTSVSTLGVLGTFYGITIGLLAFDTANLDKSIPGLLDGLKTAFFTSLAGMIGSMILSVFISRKQDEKEGGVSDINQAAGTICQAVQQMSALNAEAIGTLKKQMAEQEADRKVFYRDVLAELASLQGIKTGIDNSSSALDSIVILQRSQDSSIKKISDSLLVIDSNVNEVLQYMHHVSEIVDVVSAISNIQDSIKD